MFVSQDRFLIRCKAVAQATFIFAFSNFECSIQQSFFSPKGRWGGAFVGKNYGPGLGGFLGDVNCFSERNEVLCRSAHFFHDHGNNCSGSQLHLLFPSQNKAMDDKCCWDISFLRSFAAEQSKHSDCSPAHLQRHKSNLQPKGRPQSLFKALGTAQTPGARAPHRHDTGCTEWDMLMAITALRYLLFHPGPQLTPCSSLKSIRFMPLPSSQCAPVSHQFCLQWFSSDLAPVSIAPLTPHDIAIVLHLFPLLSMLLPLVLNMGNLSKHILCLELFCFHKLALPNHKIVGLKSREKNKIPTQSPVRALRPQSSLSWWLPSSVAAALLPSSAPGFLLGASIPVRAGAPNFFTVLA